MDDSKNFAPSRLRVNNLLEQHFDTAFAAPNGIAKLRELILTLAMQGKLVEQDENDPPASELLKEIENEREKGAREGAKTRRGGENKLPEIRAEEVPYELPKGWVWVRLGGLGLTQTGTTPPSKDRANYGNHIPFVGPGYIKNGLIDFSGEGLSEQGLSKGRLIPVNSVLMVCIGGSIGKHAINTRVCACNQQINTLTPYSPILVEYIYFSMASVNFQNYLAMQSGGSATPIINKQKWSALLIPLPPLPEQHRIVARIDQLMARCDELEKLRKEREEKRLAVHAAAIKQLLDPSLRAFASSRDPNSSNTPAPSREPFHFLAQHFGELYTVKENVAELRKAILQLAVMGRLVEQDPNDQPASELLKEIEAEKQQLVKSGKIKSPKLAPSIFQHNEPFQVPHNWRWVRIAELAEFIDYGTSQKTSDDSSLVPVYRMGNIVDGQLNDEGFKYIAPDIEELPRLFLQPNDILFNRTNSYELVGKSALYTGPAGYATFASYLIRIRLRDELLDPVYISQAMNAPYFRSTQIEPEIVQQCGQANFNGTKLSLTAIPLPPLREQHRIVARIDQLMALCDKLDHQIDAAAGKQSELLNAVMAQV